MSPRPFVRKSKKHYSAHGGIKTRSIRLAGIHTFSACTPSVIRHLRLITRIGLFWPPFSLPVKLFRLFPCFAVGGFLVPGISPKQERGLLRVAHVE